MSDLINSNLETWFRIDVIWMFNGREVNNRINRIHERALKLVYADNNSPYAKLLEKDDSVKIHQRNLEVLATEIFKVENY